MRVKRDVFNARSSFFTFFSVRLVKPRTLIISHACVSQSVPHRQDDKSYILQTLRVYFLYSFRIIGNDSGTKK